MTATEQTARPATAAQIVARLSLEQKLAVVAGRDFWTTTPLDDHGVPSIMVTDGPHGLRKQPDDADHVGIGESVPATCFPPAVGLGATWDSELLERIGAALGRETRGNNVGVLLGPGLNIKRHPAGGRNFEYFSEDPLLAGKSAAALVRGIQSEGVGACLKHFAANNQEASRMRLDTIVDERTLREIYLTGFEIAVRESDPWTVMCAYNLINGEHADVSRRLLTDILRDEWGFDGLVMTDWGATSDRAASLHAGLDLEMPYSGRAWDQPVRDALESGELDIADLDLACERVITLALRATAEASARASEPGPDYDAHHALAREAAAASTVLLANDGLLPLARTGSVALIGAFAEKPRFQGAGSSQVNPTQVDTALHALRAQIGEDALVSYSPGYDADTGETTDRLLATAQRAATDADVAVVVVGLPSSYESEGFDRPHLRLPDGHVDLIDAVTAANPRTVVVLFNGAPVEMPWAGKAAAIVESYLGGQAGGSALADVLLGDVEPGGRLAETFPMSGADLPSTEHFANHPTQVQYREGLNIGYRFHDTFLVAPRFPFGHGLGYTTWDVGDAAVTGRGTDRVVTVPVTNTGGRAGSTVVQVYVRDIESSVHRPAQELAGYIKVTLEAGASTTARVTLDRRSFAFYDAADAAWKVEGGEFEIRVGLSSRDIRAAATVRLTGDADVSHRPGQAGPLATDEEFAALLGRPVPRPRPVYPFHRDSTLGDLRASWLGRRVKAAVMRKVSSTVGEVASPEMKRMLDAIILELPLRGMAMNSDGAMSFARLDRLISILNATAWTARRVR